MCSQIVSYSVFLMFFCNSSISYFSRSHMNSNQAALVVSVQRAVSFCVSVILPLVISLGVTWTVTKLPWLWACCLFMFFCNILPLVISLGVTWTVTKLPRLWALFALFFQINRNNMAWNFWYLDNWTIPTFSLICSCFSEGAFFDIMLTSQ